MKIQVITSQREYQGLYKGSVYEVSNAYYSDDRSTVVQVLFNANGKQWSLCQGEFEVLMDGHTPVTPDEVKEEYTGKSVDYYKVNVDNPTTESNTPYLAECNDIIEALGMNYAEGNAFKAIWRKCAARKFGVKKKGYDNGLYDSEKVVFFGERMVEQSKQN